MKRNIRRKKVPSSELAHANAKRLSEKLRKITGEDKASRLTLDEEANLMYLESKVIDESPFTHYDYHVLFEVLNGYRWRVDQDLSSKRLPNLRIVK